MQMVRGSTGRDKARGLTIGILGVPPALEEHEPGIMLGRDGIGGLKLSRAVLLSKVLELLPSS